MHIAGLSMDRQARTSTTQSNLKRMLFDETAEHMALPFSLLEEITNGFSNELEIGRGAFAVVYKGILDNGTVIAVKRLSNTYMYEKEFNREVECLVKVKHKNIIRFLGYCSDTTGTVQMYKGKFVMAETQERLMCFEYLQNGSLERYITDASSGLEWRIRYKIIKGICEGLNYLHQKNIIHLDLKPANILMDEDMMPKITDFGQSRCFEEEQTRVIATKIAGTLGYLAPEFGSREVTYKFDLYSLGVIIKEILTGKKGYQDVENIIESWRIRSDTSQRGQIRVCAEIGVKCTEFNPEKRPVSIKHILESLFETESAQVIPAHGPSELLVLHQFVLRFPFEPNKVITCPLKLTSKSDRHVAFRLMAKSGDSFLRLPLYGIVPPRSVYTHDVRTEEHKELPRKRNVDLILDCATIGDDYIRSFRSQPDNYLMKAKKTVNVMQELTLKALYEPQPEMIGSSKMVPKPYHMSSEHTTSKPVRMTLRHLEDITNNFCNERILGKGGCSVVYRGVLQSGKIVAVKKLLHATPISQKQFENEINLLMKLQHPNIVRLIGYCYETQHFHTPHEGKFYFSAKTECLLCVEYLPNGSLDKYISGASSGLDWDKRCKIIQGISFGLQYLHEQANDPLVHLDLKPANILLDENMVPKIADFGLSRLFEKQTIYTTMISGTLGYMPPEYIRGIITPMFDIFSFGVMILEVITGHRDYPYDIRESSKEFVVHELRKWRIRLQKCLGYTTLENIEQIKRYIQIGLVCVNPERHKRPTMKEIIDVLQGVEIMDWYINDEGSQDYGDKEGKPMVSEVSQDSLYWGIRSPGLKEDSEWMMAYPFIGRESNINELRRCTRTARFNNWGVISVWGIAGVGKSALVRNLYYDRMIHSQQFNKYRWVDVPNPFNLRDFCRSLLSDIHSNKDPIKDCRNLLTDYQCLVVIDDLQSKEQWDFIQTALVSRPSKSVIIVITNKASIATYCADNEEQVFNVNGLEADKAFDLLRAEVHRKAPSSHLQNIKDVELQELILKCGGLPKVIVAIAGVLGNTQDNELLDTIRSLNDRFMHHLETNPEFCCLRALFGWMDSIISNTTDFLKPSIFYLTIFPQNYLIRRRRLVRRWIAEGYTWESIDTHEDENGEKIFTELLDHNIVQQVPLSATTDIRKVFYKVNGFIREYIISRRTEENLVSELGGSYALTTQSRGRHLIVLRNWDRNRVLFQSIDFWRLRSLTVFGKWDSFFMSESMKLLRVLDLENASGIKVNHLKNMVKLFRRLKFLSLRGSMEITYLPSSLGDLRELQTLDVRDTSIVTLPESITKIQTLQYIRAGATSSGASTTPASSSWLPQFCKFRQRIGAVVPGGIGKLMALHTLGVLNVSASRGKAIMKELSKLNQLRKLGVSGINRHNSKEFSLAISRHVHLKSLMVRFDMDNQGCLDDISLPWENLQSLKLYGLQNKLPQPRSYISKLRKLDLEMATIKRDDISFLSNQPELCILRLRLKQFEDYKLHFDAGMCGEQLLTFQKLKVLEISCRSSSNELKVLFGAKSMKKIELLKLDCRSASYKLIGLNYLSELKQVLLKGADDEIKTALENQLLVRHSKTRPSVKLEEEPRSS